MEHSSVEIEGALPVDCTPTIKSVKGLLKIKKYSVLVLETTCLNLGSRVPFYNLPLVTNFSHENLISTKSILNRRNTLFRGASSQGAITERILSSRSA